MSDEERPEPTVEPIQFTRQTIHTVDSWPERTSFTQAWLDHAHVYQAAVQGDTLTFDIFNGAATYTLRRDLPEQGGNVVADLVPGSDIILDRKVKGY